MQVQDATARASAASDSSAITGSNPGLPRQLAGRIALAYLGFGLLWIFATDWLLYLLGIDPASAPIVQTAKGWLFVIGTAVLIYLLLTTLQKRNEAVLAALIESRNEISRINAALEQRVTERNYRYQT